MDSNILIKDLRIILELFIIIISGKALIIFSVVMSFSFSCEIAIIASLGLDQIVNFLLF